MRHPRETRVCDEGLNDFPTEDRDQLDPSSVRETVCVLIRECGLFPRIMYPSQALRRNEIHARCQLRREEHVYWNTFFLTIEHRFLLTVSSISFLSQYVIATSTSNEYT